MLLMCDSNHKTLLVSIFGIALVVGVGVLFAHSMLFSAPQKQAELVQFTIPTVTTIAKDWDNEVIDSRKFTELLIWELKEKRFIKNMWGFSVAIGDAEIESGAYKISKSMSAFEIARVLKEGPYMRWVVIPEGLRKEQIAELLADTLGWADQEKSSWINTYTSQKFDEVEGVYFPDTYLIPMDDGLQDVANRLRAKFNEEFALYLAKANEQNIKWATLLKIASLVQREAAGEDDMPLIAGILWNRLLNDQKLDIDATVQYARDTRLAYKDDPCEDLDSYARDPKNNLCFNPELLQPSVPYLGIEDWWAPIAGDDTRSIDSLYNTYLYKGLPPRPINNPGKSAIEAVLYPKETDCFYYLHDNDGNIHCTNTYEDHKQNIKTYLKND